MLERGGVTATGLAVPAEVLDGLGAGRRPLVSVTIAGHTYRSSVGSMGGRAMLPVSAAVREATGVSAGDEVDVELELDTEPRIVTVPPDLAEALGADSSAQEFFDGLSPSRRGAWVSWVTDAKTAGTRATRVTRTVEMLTAGRAQR